MVRVIKERFESSCMQRMDEYGWMIEGDEKGYVCAVTMSCMYPCSLCTCVHVVKEHRAHKSKKKS